VGIESLRVIYRRNFPHAAGGVRKAREDRAAEKVKT